MNTTLIIGGVILLGIATWKGRKILISKNGSENYQLKISKLKQDIIKLRKYNDSTLESLEEVRYKMKDIKELINTKGMNMKKLRAIISK